MRSKPVFNTMNCIRLTPRTNKVLAIKSQNHQTSKNLELHTNLRELTIAYPLCNLISSWHLYTVSLVAEKIKEHQKSFI
jgi:hypothetical protein